MTRFAALCQGVCLTLAIAGCSEPQPEFAPVTGTLLLNGKPHRGLRVNFLPDNQKGNEWNAVARGTTDAEGMYTLQYEYKDLEGAGAPIGWHRVIVEDASRPPTPQGQTPPPPLFPATYGNPATTPLEIEVKPGPQTINLEVKS